MDRTLDKEINHTTRSICPYSLFICGKKSLVNKCPLSTGTSSYFILFRYPLVTGGDYFWKGDLNKLSLQEAGSGSQAPRTQLS